MQASLVIMRRRDQLAGVPGNNEKADQLAGAATEKKSWSPVTSLAFLKLRSSERFRAAKEAWHLDPKHHGAEEIPPPPPKKSCVDRAKGSIARTAAQIRTGPLALRGILEEDPQAHRQQLPVLQGTQDGPVPRASPLCERQATCCEGRGVGKQEPRKHPGPPVQP